jgi:hypothetical protein
LQDANDYLMSGGVKSAKFEKPGAKISGVIARKPELQNQRDFDKGTPLIWDDGQPRQQIKVVLLTDQTDDDDDNGERALYLKGGLLKAVRAAISAAKAKGLETGGKLAVKYTADGEKKGKLNPPKLYVAKYEAPDPMAAVAAAEAEAGNPGPDRDESKDGDDLDF